jgi:hypothetical protein
VLFALEGGTWSAKADLPEPIAAASAVSVAVVDKQPIIAARGEGPAIRTYRFAPDTRAWSDLGVATPQFEAEDFKLLAAPGRPILWAAPRTGAGSLFLLSSNATSAGGAWSAPVDLKLENESPPSWARTITISAERVRLLFSRDQKLFEQVYELNGTPVDGPAPIVVQTGPASETVYYWMNLAVATALLVLFLGTMRKRARRTQSQQEE